MRISDWSSDVCSSDLRKHAPQLCRNPEEIYGEGAQDRVERQEIPFRHNVRGRGERVRLDVVVRVAEDVRREEHHQRQRDQKTRSEERRVGNECVSTIDIRRSPSNQKKNTPKKTHTK